jgi:hypothetical protein
MSRLVAPLIHWLMAATVLMGPIPALVHHADCHHGAACAVAFNHDDQHEGHDHAGCEHHDDFALECSGFECSDQDAVASDNVVRSLDSHDENDCVLCQSLASPNGTDKFQMATLVCGQLVFGLNDAEVATPTVPVIGLSQSRAPPALSI